MHQGVFIPTTSNASMRGSHELDIYDTTAKERNTRNVEKQLMVTLENPNAVFAENKNSCFPSIPEPPQRMYINIYFCFIFLVTLLRQLYAIRVSNYLSKRDF